MSDYIRIIDEFAERLHSAISNKGSADLHDIVNEVSFQVKEMEKESMETLLNEGGIFGEEQKDGTVCD